MKSLSTKTQIYIIGSILVGFGLMVFQLISITNSDALVFVLAVLAAVAQIFKEEGSTETSSYNLSWLVYGFTFALFGVPATMLVITASHIIEWIVHKYPWYIQMYNIATFAISISGAGLVSGMIDPAQEIFTLQSTLALLTGLLVFTGINHFMIGVVLWLARGQNFTQSGVFGFLTLMIDFTIMALGVGTAMIWVIAPFATIFVLAPLAIIRSGLKIPHLKRQSETDPKTGLFNAKHFDREFGKLLEHANRYHRPLSIIMGDLDLLRNINNTYGHLAGDVVLQSIAGILQTSFREYDLVARFGGEEFAILLPETTPKDAFARIETVRKEIEAAEFKVDTSITPIKATMSFGISGLHEMPGAPVSTKDLINDADSALYNAKLSGRNNTRLFVSGEKIDESEVLSQISQAADPATQAKSPIAARLDGGPLPTSPMPAQEQEAMPSHTHKEAYTPPLSVNRRKHQPSAVGSRQPLAVNLYIGIVVLIAIALAVLGISHNMNMDYWGILLFSLIIMLTEGLSIEIYTKDSSISTAAALLIAGTLLFGPLAALVLSLVIAGTASIKKGSNFTRLAFNTSNHFISASLVAAFIMATNTPFASLPVGLQLVVTLISGIIVYASSTIILSGVLHLSKKQSFFWLWKEHFSWLLPYYIAFGVLGYALIIGYIYAGLFGLIAIVVPLMMLRISQAQYINNTRALVSQLHSKNDELEASNQAVTRFNEEILHSLANLLDLRDPYTMGHSENVSFIATRIAREMQLPEEKVQMISTAGLLHDIGKIGIPDSILFKPNGLTIEEFDVIKEHPVRGAEILKLNQSLCQLSPIVRHHHERYDGRGYPQGLQGEAIPLEARIMCLADSLQAMMSDRPYRRAISIDEAIREIKAHSGTQFDPQVVNIALEILIKDRNAFAHQQSKIAARKDDSELVELIPLHRFQ